MAAPRPDHIPRPGYSSPYPSGALWDNWPTIQRSVPRSAPQKIDRPQHGRRAFGGRQKNPASFVFLPDHAAFVEAPQMLARRRFVDLAGLGDFIHALQGILA